MNNAHQPNSKQRKMSPHTTRFARGFDVDTRSRSPTQLHHTKRTYQFEGIILTSLVTGLFHCYHTWKSTSDIIANAKTRVIRLFFMNRLKMTRQLRNSRTGPVSHWIDLGQNGRRRATSVRTGRQTFVRRSGNRGDIKTLYSSTTLVRRTHTVGFQSDMTDSPLRNSTETFVILPPKPGRTRLVTAVHVCRANDSRA